jgi:hypothetical protein
MRAAAAHSEANAAGRPECRWEREQLPDAIRQLVVEVEDQRRRNDLCWSVFDG